MDNPLSAINVESLLPQIVNIAKDAGEAILDVYQRTSFEVLDKEDNSPVTEADILAHNIIHEQLSNLDVQLPILSEESLKIDPVERQRWQTYWLVDPLDGTREFVKRNDEFSVNIALIHQHESILGVIFAPVTEVVHYAARSFGAYRQEYDASFRAITARQTPAKPVIFGSRSHQSPRMQKYLQNITDYQLQSMGSSLKSCMVAEGSADLYIRFGPTCEWDTAAAQCILEEAGACIVDLQMQPLRYNLKESLLNPEFIVCEKSALARWVGYLDNESK